MSAFQMSIEKIEPIPGGSCVAHGPVRQGNVTVGDRLLIRGGDSDREVVIAGVMVGGKLLDRAASGDQAGLILRRVDPATIQTGWEIVAPQ